MKKIWKTKFRNLETGKIVSMWPTTDHHQVNYNLPVWVDKTNYCYGQCDLWPVPLGYEHVMPVDFKSYKNNMKYSRENLSLIAKLYSEHPNDIHKIAEKNKIASGWFTNQDYPYDKFTGIQTKWLCGQTIDFEDRYFCLLLEKQL